MRREAAEFIAGYHRDQLRGLLEHVRDGFAQLDAGEIDAFELDDLIHRYKRGSRAVEVLCAGWEPHGSGGERADVPA